MTLRLRRLLRRRQTAALAVVAVVAAAVLAAPGPSATAQSEPAFGDVVEGSFYFDAVNALAATGVFTGTECDEGFCPDRPLKRWEMSVWLIRALDQADPNPAGASRFDDVSDGVWWLPYVERMADLKITVGCSSDPPRYCPDGNVDRGQMASFLTRALDLPAAAPAGFTDVDPNNVHADNINRLAAAEITAGCETEPLRYCPDKPVTRAHMSVFIHRALQWQKQNKPAETPARTAPTPVLVSNDTDEFITRENDFSRYIRDKVVKKYEADHPWLRATWNHTNRDTFTYVLDKRHYAAVYFGGVRDEGSDLPRSIAIVTTAAPQDLFRVAHETLVHELAHVYTLSNRVVANPAPIAAGHLYFSEMTQAVDRRECKPDELYAETAEKLVFPYATSHGNWYTCPETPDNVTAEALSVVRQAFSGQMPTWFYDTFYDPAGNPDHQAIWAAVGRIKNRQDRLAVINQLRYSFGGYCSEADVWELHVSSDIYQGQPWVDGGC